MDGTYLESLVPLFDGAFVVPRVCLEEIHILLGQFVLAAEAPHVGDSRTAPPATSKTSNSDRTNYHKQSMKPLIKPIVNYIKLWQHHIILDSNIFADVSSCRI